MRTLKSKTNFHSLPPLEWTDIPPLALVTGTNGVGKSQLLRLIASATSIAAGADTFSLFSATCDIEPKVKGGGYLPALWTTETVKVDHGMFQPIDKLVQQVRLAKSLQAKTAPSVADRIRTFFDLLSHLGLSERLQSLLDEELAARGPALTHADVFAKLGTYDLVVPDSSQPLLTLATIFYAHANARITRILEGRSAAEVDATIGIAPWIRANDLLRLFDVHFQLTWPVDFRFPYEPRCLHANGEHIPPSALSSGEQAVLALVAIVCSAQVLPSAGEEGPTLLLLDEPDAHLHTSLIKDYLHHLAELVARGMQIIMVTHRPDTITLAPEGSLVEMSRDGSGQVRLAKVLDRPALISRLAADTMAVLPGVRVILTEAEADQTFHQWAYDRALAWGLLPSNPRLEFKPVDKNGGKTKVFARVQAAHADGLQFVYRGLVDRDAGSDNLPPGVHRLERYAIENYFADPLALYAAIVNDTALDERTRLSAEVGIPRRDLHTLRAKPAEDLQRVVDHMLRRLDQGGTLSDREYKRGPVVLHRGSGAVTLQYPDWIRSLPKPRLRSLVRGAFADDILPLWAEGPDLCDLVPADLVEVYHQLITTRP